MKFSLALILCSYITNSCLLPYNYPGKYDSLYDCLIEGYEQSIIKIIDIGFGNIASLHYSLLSINLNNKIKLK